MKTEIGLSVPFYPEFEHFVRCDNPRLSFPLLFIVLQNHNTGRVIIACRCKMRYSHITSVDEVVTLDLCLSLISPNVFCPSDTVCP